MILVRLTVSVFAAAVLMTGCGTSDDSGISAADLTPTASDTATPSPSASSSLSPEEKEVAAVVETYLHAMAGGDFESACATRAAKDLRRVSRLYGSCPAAFEAVAKSQGQENLEALLGGAVVTGVTVQGDRAAADVAHPGQAKLLTLYAVREGGSWKLLDVPDAKADQFPSSDG